jgi:hypothetical protein
VAGDSNPSAHCTDSVSAWGDDRDVVCCHVVMLFPALHARSNVHGHTRVAAYGMFRDKLEALQVVDPYA